MGMPIGKEVLTHPITCTEARAKSETFKRSSIFSNYRLSHKTLSLEAVSAKRTADELTYVNILVVTHWQATFSPHI